MLKLIQNRFTPTPIATPSSATKEAGKRAPQMPTPRRAPSLSTTGIRKMFLPLAGDSDLLVSRVGDLETLLSEPAAEYRITILGPDGIMPDIALAIYHLIKDRPHSGRVVVHSLGSLMNSDVLVWLAADERTLRPDAWIRFEPIPDAGARRSRRRHHPAFGDYAQVLNLVEQYLPAEFAGRSIYEPELAEWDLVEPPRPATSTAQITEVDNSD